MKGMKVGIAVVLLVAAGIITWKFSLRPAAEAKGEDTSITWMCSDKDCSHVFSMTANETLQLQQKEEKPGEPWPPSSCPKCKARTAWPAQKCEKCGTMFFGPEVKGWTGACPKCHPDVKPPEEFEAPSAPGEAPKPRPKAI